MSRSPFSAVRTEGGLLPQEILQRVAAGDSTLPGTQQGDYHLPPHERLGEAINRSWNRLMGLWASFQEASAERPESDLLTGLTRERWLLPLFQELGYGRLQRSPAVEIEGKSFAISHLWGHTPLHLVGTRISIDRRTPGVAGAAGAAPHSLVQEFLNRSDDRLWAFVSNGHLLRILRDSHTLSRQAFVEFDLQAMMEGELFSDFRLLWLICHQSRVESETPEESWLERWFQHHREEGVRALDRLREGVERAIEALGAGFLRHPANSRLHRALSSGELDRQDYYRELLRLIYRLIFLFVAEDRDALLDPRARAPARKRYTEFYSTRRLRELAGRRRGTRHSDLWRGFQVVASHLFEGCPELGLPALGSFLWDPEALPWTENGELRNEDFLSALRHLCYFTDEKQRVAVSWRTMGSEELGSIYESLLELHPRVNREAGTFELATAAGHERKTTGSYYTPTSLVDALLDSALEPVLKEAVRKEDPEKALLDLKICDTAAGSGHFLVAAARRVAARLASIRTGDEEASPEAVTQALRDVVGRCVYGVDLNPLAVELCKVSLWMEALEPGKPLSFLDHHLQVGNSLLGTMPALLKEGIPDEAFVAIEGDHKEVVSELKKRNKKERQAQQTSFMGLLAAEPPTRYLALEYRFEELNQADDSTLDSVRRKEALYRELLDAPGHNRELLVSDAWCAAFVWPRKRGAPEAITEELFRQLERDPKSVPAGTIMEVRRLADQYRFFHFHLAFPDVFRSGRSGEDRSELTGWAGGFDVVLGNPPWERIKLQEKEWFAERRPEIAEAPNAAKRRAMIAALEEEDPPLFEAFLNDRRTAEGESHLVRSSGRFPLCGRGDVNTYSVFAELGRSIINDRGRCGMVIPSGIATDHTTRHFFGHLVAQKDLASLHEFENVGFFQGAGHGHMLRFALLTLAGRKTAMPETDFLFQGQDIRDLDDLERHFALSAEEIELINPNTMTCPIFRTRRDAEITKGICRRVPVLVKEGDPEGNPWGVGFMAMFHMANDSHLFQTREELEAEGWKLVGNVFERSGRRYLPLYEAKMMHQYNHRHGDFSAVSSKKRAHQLPPLSPAQLQNPSVTVMPFYWVDEANVRTRLNGRWAQKWFIGWRDVTDARASARTVIASVIPWAATSDKLLLMFPGSDAAHNLLANLLSLPLDYLARQKIGGIALKYFTMRQLPVLAPDQFERSCAWCEGSSLSEWMRPRVLELTFAGWDIEPFAAKLGWRGPPFQWNSKRRFALARELDAAFFHLYGVSRDDVDYIMDTFPIVRRKDEKEYGEYRTKRVILEIYDEMEEAMRTGKPYKTRLDPPPADPSLAHPADPGG